MKCVIERDALAGALADLAGIVEGRSTIPILTMVRLEAFDGALSLTVTDLDIECRVRIDADCVREGAVCAPAGQFADLCRSLPTGAEIELELAEGRLTLRAGRSRFRLPTLPASDFPEFKTDGLGDGVAIAAETLGRLMGRVLFAVSRDETRYYLTGLFLHVMQVDGAARLRAVATDGHRLALWETDPPQGWPADGAIIPRKTAGLIARLAAARKGEVRIAVGAHKVRLETDDGLILTSGVIDGAYPDYVRVIPRDLVRRAVVDSKALAQSVKRLDAIRTDKSMAVKLEFDGRQLTLSGRNTEGTNGQEEVEVDYEGDPVTIGFNGRFLTDACGATEAAQLRIFLGDGAGPARVEPEGDDGFVMVLMPLRV